jgi:membrane-associated HD superfamily phosphohydrolase
MTSLARAAGASARISPALVSRARQVVIFVFMAVRIFMVLSIVRLFFDWFVYLPFAPPAAGKGLIFVLMTVRIFMVMIIVLITGE